MKTFYLIKIITDDGLLIDACDLINVQYTPDKRYMSYERYDSKELAIFDLDLWISKNEYHRYEFTIVECYR